MRSKLTFIPLLYFIFISPINSEAPPEPPVMLPHRFPEAYAKQGTDSSIKIIRPTFFIYIREPAFSADSVSPDEILRMVQIVNNARSEEYLYDSEHLDPWVENIVIIEEDNHWVVAFPERGNGLTAREAEGVYYLPMFNARSPRLYYLSKSQLELIEKPEGSLRPLMLSMPIEISTNYPDDNVDSFMTLDEVMRRNHEIWLKETGQLEGDNPESGIETGEK